MVTITTKSPRETKRVAALLARELISLSKGSATILALKGNLGSGKTTFTQGFARALGVKENIKSPTFVLMRAYGLRKVKNFKHLVHIDCYRLRSPQELVPLGLGGLLKDQDAIILIEWAEKIKKLLPRQTIWLYFTHGRSPRTRIIKISS